MSQQLIGIDIGGTKSAVILGDVDGHVLKREQIPTAGPELTLPQLREIAAGFVREGGAVLGCGVACGGPLSTREGLVLSPPNLPGWDRVPVVEYIWDALKLPTALENDANAAAVAEWRWGLGGTVDDLVYLTCGTGQGAGLIVGGRLVRGRRDLAGEIGHVRLLPIGPVGYRKAGSVEGLTSGTALASLARLRVQEPHEPSMLDQVDPSSLTGKLVGDAALSGDPMAIRIVTELADYLGQACAILIDLLNPQRISLGSMAHRLGPLLIDGVRRAARREALPESYDACFIDRSALGDRAQDLAALAAAPGHQIE